MTVQFVGPGHHEVSQRMKLKGAGKRKRKKKGREQPNYATNPRTVFSPFPKKKIWKNNVKDTPNGTKAKRRKGIERKKKKNSGQGIWAHKG